MRKERKQQMKKISKLTTCELLVMLTIWEMADGDEKITMQEVTQRVNEKFQKNWKTQTISTFLARIVKKEFLSMKRKGRIFIYTPLVNKDEYIDTVIPAFFELLGIDRERLLSSGWF